MGWRAVLAAACLGAAALVPAAPAQAQYFHGYYGRPYYRPFYGYGFGPRFVYGPRFAYGYPYRYAYPYRFAYGPGYYGYR